MSLAFVVASARLTAMDEALEALRPKGEYLLPPSDLPSAWESAAQHQSGPQELATTSQLVPRSRALQASIAALSAAFRDGPLPAAA